MIRTGASLRAMELQAELDRLGVRVRHKQSSRLMRLLGWVLGYWWWTRAWVTIGPRTIWAPAHVALDRLDVYEATIRHELVHIQQARRYPLVWQVSYLLLPVPVVLAWCRWRWEREAYLVQLRAGAMTVEEVVSVLWRRYAWPWPRPWMRRWLARAVRG